MNSNSTDGTCCYEDFWRKKVRRFNISRETSLVSSFETCFDFSQRVNIVLSTLALPSLTRTNYFLRSAETSALSPKRKVTGNFVNNPQFNYEYILNPHHRTVSLPLRSLEWNTTIQNLLLAIRPRPLISSTRREAFYTSNPPSLFHSIERSFFRIFFVSRKSDNVNNDDEILSSPRQER